MSPDSIFTQALGALIAVFTSSAVKGIAVLALVYIGYETFFTHRFQTRTLLWTVFGLMMIFGSATIAGNMGFAL